MIETEFENDLAIVRMCHGKVNAMDREFCQTLIEAFDSLRGDGTRAVILRGNGRAFSAGIDLKRWLREGEDYVLPFIELLESLFVRVLEFPKPVVALVDGPAIAGGCMLACAADSRLIAPTASIGIPEMRIGVPLPMAAIEIVRMVARPDAFARIVKRGATYAGSEAVAVGLADEVHEADQLLPAAIRLAEEFAAIPPTTFDLTKRQVRHVVSRRIAAARQEFASEYRQIWSSPATRSAVAEYVRCRLSS